VPHLERLKAIAETPLLHFASRPVTPASFLTCLLVVSAAYLFAGMAGRTVTRVLARREVAHGASFAMAKIVRYVILLVGVTVAVASLGIQLDALLAASTVVLVGVGLGLQNIAQNFASGLFLLIEQPVARGDFVEISHARGSVTDIGLRATHVVTRDGITIIVPNSELVSGQVINHSVPTTNLRIAIRVGVAHDSDTTKVTQSLLAIARAESTLLTEPAPEVRFEDFGESTLDFLLLVWIADPREDLRIASLIRFRIAAEFRHAGIEMAFPQRDVRLIRSNPAPEKAPA
jgi:potassium efflux system protein